MTCASQPKLALVMALSRESPKTGQQLLNDFFFLLAILVDSYPPPLDLTHITFSLLHFAAFNLLISAHGWLKSCMKM